MAFQRFSNRRKYTRPAASPATRGWRRWIDRCAPLGLLPELDADHYATIIFLHPGPLRKQEPGPMVPAFAAALSVYGPMVGPWWVRDGPIVPPQGSRALLMHLSQTRASVSEIRVSCLGGVGFKASSLLCVVWAAARFNSCYCTVNNKSPKPHYPPVHPAQRHTGAWRTRDLQ